MVARIREEKAVKRGRNPEDGRCLGMGSSGLAGLSNLMALKGNVREPREELCGHLVWRESGRVLVKLCGGRQLEERRAPVWSKVLEPRSR
jgi:hypothetical protein